MVAESGADLALSATERERSVDASLYVEVLVFYAHQMRLLDSLRIEEYAATFTDDGVVVHAHRGHRTEGRAAMIADMHAAVPRYEGVAIRHWFDHVLVRTGRLGVFEVSYCSLVTRTDEEGAVEFEPSYFIEDELVRVDGALCTRSRIVHRDAPVTMRPSDS